MLCVPGAPASYIREAAGSRRLYEILVGTTAVVMRAEVGGNVFRLTCAGLPAGIVYGQERLQVRRPATRLLAATLSWKRTGVAVFSLKLARQPSNPIQSQSLIKSYVDRGGKYACVCRLKGESRSIYGILPCNTYTAFYARF